MNAEVGMGEGMSRGRSYGLHEWVWYQITKKVSDCRGYIGTEDSGGDYYIDGCALGVREQEQFVIGVMNTILENTGIMEMFNPEIVLIGWDGVMPMFDLRVDDEDKAARMTQFINGWRHIG